MAKEFKLTKFFLHIKPVDLLISLRKGPKYATILSKEVNVTYSHTVKLLDMFNDFGLVEFEKRGRIKIVKLTDMGEEIARMLENLTLKFKKLKLKLRLK